MPYGHFALDQTFDSLRVAFKEALCRRGIPAMVYTDNGKIYKCRQLQWVCASLGIALLHTAPYDAAAKGKIERFFLTVKQRFWPVLDAEKLSSLDSLNEAFRSWLEKDYNGRHPPSVGPRQRHQHDSPGHVPFPGEPGEDGERPGVS